MMYLEAVDLDKLKSQAACFSGEPRSNDLNHDKKRNNWPTPTSFVWRSGFDTGNKKFGEGETSYKSSSLSFAVSWYLIFF